MPSRRNRWLTPAAGGRPWVIAHRGDSAHLPENTLIAARRGHAAGADAWEFDVQLSRDGEPVVLHDETLARTTDAARRFAGDPRGEAGWYVADFDLHEIRDLDAGAWFLDPAGGRRSAAGFGTLGSVSAADRGSIGRGSARVPTLAEALQLTVELDWAANVELKPADADDPRLAEAALAAIDAADAGDRVILSSFDHPLIASIKARRPDLLAAALATSALLGPASYCRDRLGVDGYHASALALGVESTAYRRCPGPGPLRGDPVSEARRAGLLVAVYTVNDPSIARDLAAAGVSGIFTDDPAAILDGFGGRGPRGA